MGTVLLSFDIEEFDMPLEYQKVIFFEDQIRLSVIGTNIVLDLLKEHGIKATFFCTAKFAIHASSTIKRISNEGHEIASHAYYHSKFEESHLIKSKKIVEEISQQTVYGFRMPRMMPVNTKSVLSAGYTYDSSVNPVLIPGRYNNLKKKRTIHKEDELIIIPSSATPDLRIPLFWLSFHNFPLSLYKHLCKRTMETDYYLNLYFHPWEFIELNNLKLGMPWYVNRNTGQDMLIRINDLITWMKKEGFSFETIENYLKITNNLQS